MQANFRPDYHYLLIAPTLGAEWLFDAARQYVLAFIPTILSEVDFIALTPPNKTITLTVVARRDTAPQIGVELAQVAPYAFYDAIVRDTFEETKAELDRRAAAGQPFGESIGIVPLPTAADQISIPTPWPTTGGPTAIPTVPAPVTPLPTSANGPAPITPTTGPITGG